MSFWDSVNNTVAQAPEGENPYAYVSENLPELAVVGDGAPVAFMANMLVVIALYGIAMIVGSCTLLMKWKQGSLWFFKTRTTGDSETSLWLPNTTVLFTCWSIFFTSSSITYITLLICAQKRLVDASAAQSMMVLIWLPMLFSLWTEFWGMAGALLISNPNMRCMGVKIRPWMLNTFAVLYYIIAPPALTPDFARAAEATGKVEDSYRAFISWLTERAGSWDGSSAFVLDSSAEDIGSELIRASSMYPSFLGHGFVIFMALTLYAIIAFLPTSLSYLKLLRRQLSSAQPSHQDSQDSARSDRFESLQMSYHVMLIEAVLVLFACVTYIALNAWAGFTTKALVSEASQAIVQHALFYYTFALLGVPVTCLIAYRTFNTYRDDKTFSNRFSSSGRSSVKKPIMVSTEVEVSVADPCSWIDLETKKEESDEKH